MVRDELRLRPGKLAEARLQALWRTLDADSSGWISAKEFGYFMRKGEKKEESGWRERLTKQNAATRRALKEDLDRRVGRDLNARLAEIAPAGEGEVTELSRLLNERLSAYADPQAREWFRLFRHMDDDGTGRISYRELEGMVRDELRLSSTDLSEYSLQSLWRALDTDSSGYISAGEFGRFMRKGEDAVPGQQFVKQRHRDRKAREASRLQGLEPRACMR